MTDIDTLIRDLEAATEGSLDLDYRIDQTLNDCERLSGELFRYTTSLDAALTLVPNDVEWQAGSAKLLPNGYWASVVNSVGEYAAKSGPTPALALCIASFKARSAETPPAQNPAHPQRSEAKQHG